MNSKSILQTIVSLVAPLGINAIPAGLVIFGGSSVETAMVLYFIENVIGIGFATARVLILAPARDEAYATVGPAFAQGKLYINDRLVERQSDPASRRTLVGNYLIGALAFSLGSGVFLFIFVFLILHAPISTSVIVTGMEGIVAFQVFHFVADLFLLGRLTPERAANILQQSWGRIGLLFLAVFIGIFLAASMDRWFVLPFAALKTIADLTPPIQVMIERIRSPQFG